jgi:hypothetical protein
VRLHTPVQQQDMHSMQHQKQSLMLLLFVALPLH